MNQIELPHQQRIAVIEAGWHADIVHQATTAFIDTLAEAGIPASSIDVLGVPGAFEIPLAAQRLARSGKYAAVAGCALVVDGGIKGASAAEALIMTLANQRHLAEMLG